MKRLAPLVMLAAAVLIAVGLVVRHRNPATPYTDDRAAWQAYEQGDAMLQAVRYDRAEKQLRAALAADPDLAPAHAALGELSYRMGISERGRRHVQIADSLAAALADDRARVLLQLRLSDLRDSRYRTARDSLLGVARELAPSELVVLVAEAIEHDRAGDLASAEQVWQHILEINPNYAAAYNFLGYLFLNQGRYDEAEAAMRRYAFVAPDLANPHDSLGDVLSTVGRYEEAEAEYRTALAKDPSFYYSLVNLSEVFLMRGEVDRALSVSDQVLAEIAGTEHVHSIATGTIGLLFNLRLYEEAATRAARYLANAPAPELAGWAELQLQLARGDLAAGTAVLDSLATALTAEPWYGENPAATTRADARLLRFRAVIDEMAGEHQAAADRFARVLALQEDWPPHHRLYDRVHLAYNLIASGALDRARVQVGEALAVNPRLAEGVLVAGSIEAVAGNASESRRLLDSLERMLDRADPDFPALADARRLREQLPDPDRI